MVVVFQQIPDLGECREGKRERVCVVELLIDPTEQAVELE
jgi:hypothetical protein